MPRNIIYSALIICALLLNSSCTKFFGTEKAEPGQVQSSEASNRSTATNHVVSPNELENAAGFPQFRDNLLGKNSSDELAQFIDGLDSPQYRSDMIASQSLTYILAKESVKLTAVNRGIFYRMRNLVKKHNFSRMTVVQALRITAAGIDTFLPGNQWKAGFDYATEPYYPTKENDTYDIDNDEEFKAFLVTEVDPALQRYEQVLDFLIANVGSHKLYWDNIIFNQNFTNDNQDRFTELGTAELKAMKAGVLFGRSAIQSIKAYQLTGFFQLVDDLSKSFGVGALFKRTDSQPDKRNDIIKDAMDDGFLAPAKISDAEFRGALAKAYEYAVLGVKSAEDAWKVLRDEDNNYDMFFKAQAAIPFTRIINNSFKNLKIIAGKHPSENTVVSVVANGEQLTFSLKTFFIDDPITGKPGRSFKDFLPTKYNGQTADLNKTIAGENVEYTNFRAGNPDQWNGDIYKTYFGTDDVRLINRVLVQSWGAAGFALPLLPVIM